jgi:hypothetical protein
MFYLFYLFIYLLFVFVWGYNKNTRYFSVRCSPCTLGKRTLCFLFFIRDISCTCACSRFMRRFPCCVCIVRKIYIWCVLFHLIVVMWWCNDKINIKLLYRLCVCVLPRGGSLSLTFVFPFPYCLLLIPRGFRGLHYFAKPDPQDISTLHKGK